MRNLAAALYSVDGKVIIEGYGNLAVNKNYNIDIVHEPLRVIDYGYGEKSFRGSKA